jgi:hypothetical protein
MKLAFSSSSRPGGAKIFVLLCLILIPFVTVATDSIAIFTGEVVNPPPQVDATNFLNEGTWDISTPAPFETANTLNYTNEGSMVGSVGWSFGLSPANTGPQGMSASFFNDSPATIQANDGLVANPSDGYANYLVSYLLVSATNIVNKGTLMAGAGGEIVLTGTNVTLARSDLEITPIQGVGSGLGGTNFTPDVATYSLFWANATNTQNLVSSDLWNGTNVSLLSFLVNGNVFNVSSSSSITNVDNFNGLCGASNVLVKSVQFYPAPGSDSTNVAASITNIVYTNLTGTVSMTNIITLNQAVFLNIVDSNITGQVRFSPSLSPTNYGLTVAVRLAATSTNVFTQLPQTSAIYLVDTLVSATNNGLLPDLTFDPYYECSSTVFRPANYGVSRTDSGGYFANGSPGGGLPPANFFYNPNFSNAVVQADYAAYAAYIDNVTADQQAGTIVTNLGGRIIITADNLDLTRAGLSAQGDIMIQANNLIGSTGAVVSCQNLSFNLGSQSGYLNFTNLAGLTTSRLQGNVAVYSYAWTNGLILVLPDYTNTPTTNIVPVEFYAMVVDASSLSSTVPVTVQNLILNSTNMVVSDSVNVDQTLGLNGQSFTLLGAIYLSSPLLDWTYASAPSLLYFTNDGTLYIPNDAHFGDDGPTNYATFVNNDTGTIYAGSQTIDSDVLDLYGIDETAFGPFSATTGSGILNGALIFSAQDIRFAANSLQINQSTLEAAGALGFTVTNSLSDSGSGSGNLFSCENGFNLFSWPAGATGDLLGTTFRTTAVARQSVTHTWAAQDLGATVAGFANNAAIDNLVLIAGGNGGSFQEPQFVFSGTGAHNGLYVNYLDLSHLTNYNFLDGQLVSISPNLTIYFAGASTNPAALDGQFGGHLRYVSGFVNKTAPPGNTTLSGGVYNNNNGAFQFSITSGSGQTNIIQISTNLVNWTSIYTNIGSFMFTDPIATNYPSRFYRVLVPSP